MRRGGQGKKRDANESDIRAALHRVGVQTWQLAVEGMGDLLTYHRGVWGVIEVKRPDGSLTPAQVTTRLRAPYPIVETIDEALALFGLQPTQPAPVIPASVRTDRGGRVLP